MTEINVPKRMFFYVFNVLIYEFIGDLAYELFSLLYLSFIILKMKELNYK